MDVPTLIVESPAGVGTQTFVNTAVNVVFEVIEIDLNLFVEPVSDQ